MTPTICAIVAILATPVERPFTFESPRAQTHRAILTVPETRGGASVLLIGGGAGWDEHWTAPGSYTIGGQTTRVTIDGHPTRDADTIAAALAARGFVVMRWSGIHTEDEQGKANPALAAGLPYPYSVELTRAALAVLRSQPEADGRRVVLIGHSLGAARACQVADDGVEAMVFLAGAYLSRTARSPRELAAGAWADYPGLDADGSGIVDASELAAFRPPAAPVHPLPSLNAADRDGDGLLRPWEFAASVWMARADAGDTTLLPTKPTLGDNPWPSERLQSGTVPVLALFGGLDPMSFHGPCLERMAANRPNLDVDYFPGLGHQLAPEQDGLCGAIAPEVVERLADWLARTTQARPPAR